MDAILLECQLQSFVETLGTVVERFFRIFFFIKKQAMNTKTMTTHDRPSTLILFPVAPLRNSVGVWNVIHRTRQHSVKRFTSRWTPPIEPFDKSKKKKFKSNKSYNVTCYDNAGKTTLPTSTSTSPLLLFVVFGNGIQIYRRFLFKMQGVSVVPRRKLGIFLRQVTPNRSF